MISLEGDQSMFVQLEVHNSYRNLLFNPEGDLQNREMQTRRLFEIYGDPEGCFVYCRLDDQALVGVRSNEVDELKVYRYDNEAPYEGVLFVEDFIQGMRLKK